MQNRKVLAAAIAMALSLNVIADESEQSPASNDQTQQLSNDNNTLENGETLVVRSQWREKNLNESTSSIVMLFDEDFQRRAAKHLDELLGSVANVTTSSGASRSRFVQIRGIGERSQFQDPINPSVGFYIDGIDFSGVMGLGTLYDVEQLEVLRGPQGTRFGASSLAGAIYLQSADTFSESDRVDLLLADANAASAGVAIGHQWDESIAARVAVQRLQSDGFTKNIFLDREDTQNIDELTGRFKVEWRPNDYWRSQFAWHHFNINNGYDAFSLDNDRNTRSDEPGFDYMDTNAFSVQTQYFGSDAFDINWTFASSASDLGYGYDEDWTYVGFHPWEYSSTDHYFRQKDIVNSDFRLTSKQPFELFGNDTQWVAGLYFKTDDEKLNRQYTYLTEDFNSFFETRSIALYSELDSTLSENMSLSLGLRHEQREADYQDGSIFDNQSKSFTSYRLALSYQFSRRSQFYALAATGFKAGGFNPQVNLDTDLRQYDTESNTNIEFGWKHLMDNSKGHIRLAIFHIDRNDQQTKNWQLYTRPDNTSEFIGYIDNVDNGFNQGVELETRYVFNDQLSVNASFGYLHTELKEIYREDQPSIYNRSQAMAPNYTYSITTRYAFNDWLDSSLTYEGSDEYYFSDNHEEEAKAYQLLYWNISTKLNAFELSLWVRNALDEDYYVRGFGGFGNDPRDGYATSAYYQLADPRQIGVSARYEF